MHYTLDDFTMGNDYTLDDLKKWCEESEYLKGHKLQFALTCQRGEGRCVQVLCDSWPVSEHQFNDPKLWPTGARLRKWNDEKLWLYKQKPFFYEFIGNCGKETTKEGIERMINQAYGGEGKVH